MDEDLNTAIAIAIAHALTALAPAEQPNAIGASGDRKQERLSALAVCPCIRFLGVTRQHKVADLDYALKIPKGLEQVRRTKGPRDTPVLKRLDKPDRIP
ncbi:hypothetical protein ANO14919_145560 [Xylariales sp. No.14919]|nr:hypothetical protein ANO14919_145560 [Xylariales sp. No.14919]